MAVVLRTGRAVLALSTLAFVIGLNDDDDPNTDPVSGGDSTSSTPAPQDEATQEGMEAFIEDYLDLVTRDPEAAFEMLTPDYQDASDGIDGYREFWDTVEHHQPPVRRRGPRDDGRGLPLHGTSCSGGARSPRTCPCGSSRPTAATT